MVYDTLVLRGGRIVETGRTADVFANLADEHTRRRLEAVPDLGRAGREPLALGAETEHPARTVSAIAVT